MRIVLASVAAVVVTAGCAPRSGPAANGIAHPRGADQLVVRVATGGGFVPVDVHLREMPEFSLFGDGRVIVPGPQIEIYPAPALPAVSVMRVTEEGIQAILREARDAGLFAPDRHYDNPMIADAPTTVFTVVAEGERHEISVYALGLEDAQPQEPESDDAAARRRLARFAERMRDLRRWLPEGSVGEESPYVADRFRIHVLDRPEPPDPEIEQPEKRWPLSTPLSELGMDAHGPAALRCGVVDGEEAEAVREAAREANQLTPWASDGRTYGLVFRPLLPDEEGC